jgi:N-acetylglucosamine-6-phosphate deacetylase
LRTAITNGRVITPLEVFEQADVVIESDKIIGVGPGLAGAGADQTIDAAGCIVAPGFIDIHVHGSAGHDTMDGTRKAIEGMAQFFAAHGVTAFCPTTMTVAAEDIMTSVKAVHEAMIDPVNGAQPLGVHLEGPYIDAAKKGAQPAQFVRTATALDYRQFFSLGDVRLVSLAVEIPENKELISFARSRGAAVAVGHSSATYEQVAEAVKLGVNQSTHTFNQMEGLHHRKPGTVGAALLLREIYAQFIADGIHLHPAVVDMIVRLKGPERAVVITDAISGAGMPDGEYVLGGQKVVLKDGAVRLPDGTLAGSSLTVDAGVRNVHKFTGRCLRECIQMATFTPARSIGVASRKGSLEPGKDADIVLLTPDLQVKMTMVMGKVAYQT